MEMVKVESSNIRAVGYDGGTLVVEFAAGSRYEYRGVPADVHAALVSAPSKGKAFRQLVFAFPELYPCRRLDA